MRYRSPASWVRQLFALVKPRSRAFFCAVCSLVPVFFSVQVSYAQGVQGAGGLERIEWDEEETDSIPERIIGKSSEAKPEVRRPVAKWAVPPIPFSGTLSIGLGWNTASDGPLTTSQSRGLSLSGSSHVVAPWLARVGASGSFYESEGSGVKGQSIGLSGDVSVLPATRYPFNASMTHSESAASSRGQTTATNADVLSLNQLHRSVDGLTMTTGSYQLLTSSFTGGGKTTSENLSLSHTKSIPGDDPENYTARLDYGGTSAAKSSGESYAISGSHSMSLSEYVLDYSTTGSYAQSGGSSGQVVKSGGLGAGFNWIPSDDYPLALGGSASANRIESISGGLGEIDSGTLSLRASYPIESWQFGANFSSYTTSQKATRGASVDTQVMTLDGSASWRGHSYQSNIFGFAYSFYYGGGLSGNFTQANAGQDASTLNAYASVGQSLSRDHRWASPDGRVGSLTYNTSVDNSAGTDSDIVTNIRTAVAISWNASATAQSRQDLSFSFQDFRTIAATESEGQSFTSTLVGAYAISYISSATTNVNLVGSRQSSSASKSDAEWVYSLGGGASYNNIMFLGVPGLNYTLAYTLGIRPRTDTSGVQDYSKSELDHLITQNWSISRGKLTLKLDNSITFAKNRWVGSVALSLIRNLSGVI